MTALDTSLISLAVILGGAFVGMWLRKILPERHLADDAKEVVRLGTGLIATISAPSGRLPRPNDCTPQVEQKR